MILQENPKIEIYNDNCLGINLKIDYENWVLMTSPVYTDTTMNWLLKFNRYIIWGFPYFKDLQATGWIIWDKQPDMFDRMERKEFPTGKYAEMASTTLWQGLDVYKVKWEWYERKGGSYVYDHPSEQPPEIYEIPIKEWTNENDIIFDPYMGCGSAGVAAKKCGRGFIGVEIVPKYFEIAKRRLCE